MEGVEAWKILKRGEIIADVRGERGMMMTGVAPARGGGICNLRYSRSCIRFVSGTAPVLSSPSYVLIP